MSQVKDYSVEEKLSSLVKLQKIDSKLDGLQILKGELPIEVSDLEDEIAGLNARQNRIEEEMNGIQQFIEDKKTLIKDSQDLIKKYEKQSDNVKNNREFEAINKEIEMQTLEVKLAEKHIKDATEDIAEKAKQLELAKKAVATKEGNLKGKKSELEKIIAETDKEEKNYNKQAAAAREQERLAAAGAEPDAADLPVRCLETAHERGRTVQVPHRALVGHGEHRLHELRDLPPGRPFTRVQVRRKGAEADVGEPPRNVPDVIVEAHRLVQDQQPGSRIRALGLGEIAGDRVPIRAGERVVAIDERGRIGNSAGN